MRIFAGRRDDIIRQRDEYDTEYKRRKQKVEDQEEEWRAAEYAVYNEVADVVRNQLKGINLDLDISCDRRWGNGLCIYVRDDNDKFNADKALSWNWEVYLNKDGEVIKDSGSWSGLKAVSEANIQYLEEILKCVKILNNMDWPTILDKQLPKFSEYVTETVPNRNERPDFESQLFEVDVEEAVGTGKLIIGHGYKYYRPSASVVYEVLSESPKQYTVCEMYMEEVKKNPDYRTPSYRIPKAKFREVVNNPIKYLEV